MTAKFTSVKKQAREVRKGQNVVNKYYKNMTNTNYVAPQFMDNKIEYRSKNENIGYGYILLYVLFKMILLKLI